MTALELAGKIVSCIDAKKGEDIKLLDVHDRTTLCDYFVIASGSSTPQLRAMADEIDEKLSELGIDARRREGWETADWLLLDYETVIVHLFRGEVREFYSLERLWRDAQEVDIEYKIIDECGVPHNKIFIISILIDGKEMGVGKGKNKKEAEQAASKQAMKKLKIQKY